MNGHEMDKRPVYVAFWNEETARSQTARSQLIGFDNPQQSW